jgi:hypothetical protein
VNMVTIAVVDAQGKAENAANVTNNTNSRTR